MHADSANADVQSQAYKDLETILNELSDTTDLSSSLTGFFNSLDEVVNDPSNAATRNLVVGKGISLAQNFNDLHSRVSDIQQELDKRVVADADQINSLTEQIRRLNVQIATSEGGNSTASEAAALRVQRQTAVDSLSQLLGIQVNEQPSGGLNISVGGELLVFEGTRRLVDVSKADANGNAGGKIEFAGTHAPITTSSGEVQGLYSARDDIIGGFLTKLDDLAATLANEFNKLYTQGQGLVGFDQLTSTNAVNDSSAALDAAGLAFTPTSGSFDLLVHSKGSDLTTTTTIPIDLNGLDEDTSLTSLAQQLNAVEGISASVSSNGQLQIKSDSTDIDFGFSGDTSGVLAALGLNTFFTGSTAASIGVNDELKGIANAGKLAASLGGIGQDAHGAERLAAFLDQPLASQGNASLSDKYNQILNEVTQGSAASQSMADGFHTFEGSLEAQQQSVSGVSIDEEAVNMLTLQRIYQASAKYIQTISDLLDMLAKI